MGPSKFVDNTSLGGKVSALEGNIAFQRVFMSLENQADRNLWQRHVHWIRWNNPVQK